MEPPVDLSPSQRTHTIPAVAAELGVSYLVAQRLIESELGGPSSTDGTIVSMSDEALRSLVIRRDQWADTSVPGIAVRVGPARWIPEEGRFIGWSRYLNRTYRDEAIRMVWGVRDAEETIGAAFVVAIGGWVAEVRSIADVEDVPGGRAFTLGEPTADFRRAYEGKRLPPTRGRQVIRLGGV